MNRTDYKPDNYNSVSPYFVVEDAQKLIDLLVHIFDAKPLRRYENEDGSIMHAEIRIDDSILMFGNSNEQFPANQLLTHIYVPDVDTTFKRAINGGCIALEEPKARDGDLDKRGSFKDFAGNVWSIGTQKLIS